MKELIKNIDALAADRRSDCRRINSVEELAAGLISCSQARRSDATTLPTCLHKDDGKVEEVPALLNLCRLESQGMKGAFIASNQARSSQAKKLRKPHLRSKQEPVLRLLIARSTIICDGRRTAADTEVIELLNS
ncbi:unnamed protein product [Sphagnum jensenii]|jgi:hypothetical protein|uniref:Uncharacterized protein n=1 Tax=Sphagnum jensenii TaxID=128206 RepID=A0ABP1A2R6_9BRYO